MRARNIKPGFFKNEILGAMQPTTRLLFAGLWCCADRNGRMDDRPARIKVEVLPYDDCDVDVLLGDLAQEGFIKRYSLNGNKYIEITNFLKHQHPHIKESDGIILSPDKHRMNTKRTPCTSGVKTPDSLIPDSLIPDSLYMESFEVFWKEYPKKIGKGYAKKIWEKIKPDDALLKVILGKIAEFKNSEQWKKDQGQFIPHPATWLNQGRWEDEIQVVKNKWTS